MKELLPKTVTKQVMENGVNRYTISNTPMDGILLGKAEGEDVIERFEHDQAIYFKPRVEKPVIVFPLKENEIAA